VTPDTLRAWLTDLDPLVIPVLGAIAVALMVAAIASFIPERRSVDQRLRALSRPHGDGAAPVTTQVRRIPGRSAMMDALQNLQSEWLARSSGFARKRMRLLNRAGLRGPRALLMVEGGRLLLTLGLPFGLFLVLRSADAFVLKPLLSWGLVGLATIFGFALPDILLQNRINKRRAAFLSFWDDAIGLLIIFLMWGCRWRSRCAGSRGNWR
jgi:tight adherence protein C